MVLTVSKNGYSCKFTTNSEYSNVIFTEKEVNGEEFIDLIKTGHLFNKQYTLTEFKNFGFSFTQNFISASYMFIDMDNAIDDSLSDVIDKLTIKPYYAYTSFSHKVKGNRYRLLYIFDEPITDREQYTNLYWYIHDVNNISNLILKEEGIKEDNCGKSPYQNMWGSNSTNEYFDEFKSNELLSIKEIDLKDNNLIKDKKYHSDYIKERERTLCILNDTFFDKNSTFIKDYFKLSLTEFLEKYNEVYSAFEITPLGDIDEDIPNIELPYNYCSISRKIKCRVNPLTHKNEVVVELIKDGEGRKRILFLNGVLRRWMLPNITFEHLLYCLNYELYYYIDNRKDVISKKDLLKICINSYRADISKYESKFKKDKRKYIVNPKYCAKYGYTKNQVKNMYNPNKTKRIEVILDCFDFGATQEENLSVINTILEADGIKPISLITFKRDIKELGLQKKDIKGMC